MTITFDEVTKHIEEIKPDLTNFMDKIYKHIISERDEHKLPVYSIKSRVKGIESAYLKTKRKNYITLDRIKDYAGMRILCLFESDIFEVHDFLLKYLKYEKHIVNEIKIYIQFYFTRKIIILITF